MIRGRMLTNHLQGRRMLRFEACRGGPLEFRGMRGALRGQARWRFMHSALDAKRGFSSILTHDGIRTHPHESS